MTLVQQALRKRKVGYNLKCVTSFKDNPSIHRKRLALFKFDTAILWSRFKSVSLTKSFNCDVILQPVKGSKSRNIIKEAKMRQHTSECGTRFQVSLIFLSFIFILQFCYCKNYPLKPHWPPSHYFHSFFLTNFSPLIIHFHCFAYFHAKTVLYNLPCI